MILASYSDANWFELHEYKDSKTYSQTDLLKKIKFRLVIEHNDNLY